MSDYSSTYTEGTGDTIDTSDFSTEFDAIATASATKADKATLTAKTADLNTKVLDIGDWNMHRSAAGSATVSVTHGVTSTKIRSVNVVIRPDTGTTYTVFPYIDLTETAGSGNGISILASDIELVHGIGSIFDGTLYDATPFNRGWITIQYTD